MKKFLDLKEKGSTVYWIEKKKKVLGNIKFICLNVFLNLNLKIQNVYKKKAAKKKLFFKKEIFKKINLSKSKFLIFEQYWEIIKFLKFFK